jgi:hypothetical protein
MHIFSFAKNISIFLLALLTACSSNDPEIQGYCVEYESTDINGNPDNTFFAYNVKTFQEGKDLLANRVGGGINEAINKGSCNSQNTDNCTQHEEPVCATTTSGDGDAPPKTYSDLCLLKSEVKKLSGTTSKAKASFEAGACKI